MTTKSILIIGGYGLAGTKITQLLLKATPYKIIVAGRNTTRASRLAEKFNSEQAGNRVQGLYVDVSDVDTVEKTVKQCDLVVVCIPANTGANVRIAQAALDAGVDYVNLEVGSEERTRLNALSEAVIQSGYHFLTDAGIFPGTPAMLIHLAASKFSNLKSVVVSMIGCATQGSIATSRELISADIKAPCIFKNGDWHKISMTASRKMDFGPPFGERACYPCNLNEITDQPERFGTQNIELYAGETNVFVMVVLLIWNILRLNKFAKGIDWGAELFVWGLGRFAKRPFGVTVKMDATGEISGIEKELDVYLHCSDAYTATAIAAVASILQILDGTVKHPGLMFMGDAVNVDRYMHDVEKLGMQVNTVWKNLKNQ